MVRPRDSSPSEQQANEDMGMFRGLVKQAHAGSNALMKVYSEDLKSALYANQGST